MQTLILDRWPDVYPQPRAVHLDDEIYRIEEEIDFATDQEIEGLKMRRAKLKDYIYHLIRHAPAACPTCEGTGVAP